MAGPGDSREPAPLPGFGGLTVRPVAERDAEALSRFYQALSPRSEYFFRPYRDKSPEAMAHVIRQTLAGHEDGYLVIGEAGDAVGHIFFGDLSREVPHLGIGLADECQNSGLGTVLLQYLIAAGRRKLGKRAIGLSVMKTNTRAVRVYEKCGFRIRGQCTFRSVDDSYVMELDFTASDREDAARLDERSRRVLGIAELRWGGEGVAVLPMGDALADRPGGEWSLGVAALLRQGRCIVSARPEILTRVREIASRVSVPESVFGEDVRRELEGAVLSGPGRPDGGEDPPAAWSSVFFCPAGSLRFRPDPDVREISAEEAGSFAQRAGLPGDSLSRGEPDVGTWGKCSGGEIRACAFTGELQEAGSGTIQAFAAASPGGEGPEDLEAVLSPLVAEARKKGLVPFVEAQYDDVSLIRAVEGIGMRKYGDLYRIWREVGREGKTARGG